MSEVTEGQDVSLAQDELALSVDEPKAEETPVEEAPKPARKRPSKPAPKTVTIRNLTRRLIVAKDVNGSGIYIFPSVEVEIAADLVSPDLSRKATLGLIALD